MLLIPRMRVFLNKTKQNKTNTKSRKILTINIEGLYSMPMGIGGVKCESVWSGGGGGGGGRLGSIS